MLPLCFDPEERGAEDIRDFKHINLLGGAYKLLAIRSNKMVVGKAVSESQNAFVEGKFLMQFWLQMNEWILS